MRWLAAPLALATAACVAPGPGPVVVLGMDGLEWSMVSRLVEEGKLPHFETIAQEGVVAEVATTHPILSPIIWTTLASGYPGEVHGVGGWVNARGRPSTAVDVRTRRLWDVASAQDRSVLVAGWLMTWPASPVHGQLYSDKLVWAVPLNKDPADPTLADSQARHAALTGLAWPPDAQARGAARIPSPADLAGDPIEAQVQAFGAPFHPWTRDETQVRHFEAEWTEDTDLAFVYTVAADQVSHLFWPFTDPAIERQLRQDPEARMRAAAADRQRRAGARAHPLAQAPMTPEDFAEGEKQVPLVYGYLDDVLGRVLDRIDGTDATLVVVSDHGFRPGRRSPVLSGGHSSQALVLGWGPRARPGATLSGTRTVLDVAPTLAALAGLPPAADWTGAPLDALFDLPAAAEPVDTWTLVDRSLSRAAEGPLDAADAALMEQLEALGYLDAEGAPVLGASRQVGEH